MVGPTQGGDGLGLGRGGGWYRRRLERDFGMRKVPFPGRRPARRGRAATTNDRTLAGRLAATVALAAVLGLAGCAGGGSDGPTATTTPERLGATPLVARNQQQFQADLAALRGRVVVVNFWASWCVPCREEMPAFAALQTKHGGKDFEVVAINIDKGGPETAAAFLKETGATNLALYTDPTGKLFATLKAVGMPTTLLIDREGKEIARLVGPADWASPEAIAVMQAALNATNTQS